MDFICRDFDLSSNSQILGDRDQVLQVVLQRNNSIVFKKSNLYYFSSTRMEELSYSKKNSKDDDAINKIGWRIKDNNIIKISNKNNFFEFVGLSNGGKIMKIFPYLYKDLFIRLDCFLACSDGIDLLEIPEVKYSIEKFHRSDSFLNKDHRFYMIYNNKNPENVYENCNITDYPALKRCLYLSNQNMLVEKRLGINEELAIRNNSLVCFERTVNFNKMSTNNKYNLINKNDYITVEGPGLIIFEINHENIKKLESMKNFKNFGVIAIVLVIVLSILNYVIDNKFDFNI